MRLRSATPPPFFPPPETRQGEKDKGNERSVREEGRVQEVGLKEEEEEEVAEWGKICGEEDEKEDEMEKGSRNVGERRRGLQDRGRNEQEEEERKKRRRMGRRSMRCKKVFLAPAVGSERLWTDCSLVLYGCAV